MDPSWTFENRRPGSLAGPFPVISLGSAAPGQSCDVYWQVQVTYSGDLGTWSLWQETYGCATAVPEPSAILALLTGCIAMAPVIRRR